MDKSTLSNYGWVVIVTLVLAVMLALATPFGSYVGKGASNVIKMFAQSSDNAIDEDNIDVQSDNWDDYLNDGLNENGVLTRKSENKLMVFVDENGNINDKMFMNWAGNATKVVIEQKQPTDYTLTTTPANASNPASKLYVDISEAQDKSVIAYLTQDGTDITLHIAGKDGVVMANENSAGLFAYMNEVTSYNFNNSLNTSNTTWMIGMFVQNLKLTSLNLSSFDTSNVTDMTSMFDECRELKALNIKNFNTSNVLSMCYMFGALNSMPKLDVSHFDVSKVENFGGMFAGCSVATSINVSGWNTSSATDMNHMFAACRTITSLDVSSFNTSKVTDFSTMFSECASLKIIDISSFDTSAGTNFEKAFEKTSSLEHVYVGEGFDQTKTYPSNIFLNSAISNVEFKS